MTSTAVAIDSTTQVGSPSRPATSASLAPRHPACPIDNCWTQHQNRLRTSSTQPKWSAEGGGLKPRDRVWFETSVNLPISHL